MRRSFFTRTASRAFHIVTDQLADCQWHQAVVDLRDRVRQGKFLVSQVDASSGALRQDGHTRCFELVQWLAAQGQLGGPDEVGGCAQILELRSEERRVGKECRSRWSPYH